MGNVQPLRQALAPGGKGKGPLWIVIPLTGPLTQDYLSCGAEEPCIRYVNVSLASQPCRVLRITSLNKNNLSSKLVPTLSLIERHQ